MPFGTKTSTAELFRRCYPDEECGELIEIHFALEKQAKKEGINLDFSARRDKEERMPYNLDFVIK